MSARGGNPRNKQQKHPSCCLCWCCLFVNYAATSASDRVQVENGVFPAGVDDFVDVLVEFDVARALKPEPEPEPDDRRSPWQKVYKSEPNPRSGKFDAHSIHWRVGPRNMIMCQQQEEQQPNMQQSVRKFSL